MKARNQQEYKQAWQWHIDQLASLALAANVKYEEYIEIKSDLETWIDRSVKLQTWKDQNG